jgi:uncharacterized protein YecT (DUF1311 family)
MRLIKIGSLSVACIAANAYTFAEESPAYTTCMDTSGGVTVNMLDCVGAGIELQDGLLNQNYKAAMQALTPGQQTQLRDAQRLWIKLRDADCDLLSGLTGGTMDSLNSSSCVLDMTKARVEHLGWLAENGSNQ